MLKIVIICVSFAFLCCSVTAETSASTKGTPESTTAKPSAPTTVPIPVREAKVKCQVKCEIDPEYFADKPSGSAKIVLSSENVPVLPTICSRKDRYRDPADKHNYLECQDGFERASTCSDQDIFDEGTKLCKRSPGATTVPPITTSSICSAKGMYKDPANNHRYHVCKDGKELTIDCPEGMIFDDEVKTCT